MSYFEKIFSLYAEGILSNYLKGIFFFLQFYILFDDDF